MSYYFLFQCQQKSKNYIYQIPTMISSSSITSILFDLYGTTYELISPIQFKNYVVSQRYHRCLNMKEAGAVDLFYRNFTSTDSMEGNAINLRKYTNDDYSSFTARDVKRVENIYSYLQQLQRKLLSVKEKIAKLRSNLYDMNHGRQTNSFLMMEE